jgi:V8-like Glu-specific endopeptidase
MQVVSLSASVSNYQTTCQINNVIVTDSNNNKLDFCHGDIDLYRLAEADTFTFASRDVAWIRLERTRSCYFCNVPLSFSFELSFSNEVPTVQSIFPKECGIAAVAPNFTLKIVNGIDAVKHSWPWQALVLTEVTNQVGYFQCGASLINSQWLITAAHCLDNEAISNILVYLGLHDINNDMGEELEQEKVILVRNIQLIATYC